MFNKNKKKGAKVMVVEDDALLSQVLSKALTAEGFSVISVKDGLDAISLGKKHIPDVILLDLILPSLDGFGVLENLKSDNTTKNIPVAVISNLDNVADIKSVKVLGAEEFFIKANTELEKIVKFVKSKIK
jgi:CheY-like chemotaxis protein